MRRYFIEVAYKGDMYAGFQKQENANTIQAEVERALSTYFRSGFELTGSSRTDAGVHARQNFFHFDSNVLPEAELMQKSCYHLNAILPGSIVINRLFEVEENAHCRFDAVSRTYEYSLYAEKNPFQADRAYYYPYSLNFSLLQAAADSILKYSDFEAFSKKSTQVHTFKCRVLESTWQEKNGILVYRVRANRFLRGMVKGLVGTMLKVGREKTSQAGFESIIQSGDPSQVEFSVPSHGLTLIAVSYE